MKKLICVMTVLAVATAQAETIYVDDDAPPGGDGLSWKTAFRFLQDGLANAIAGSEIRVAHGVYRPDQDEAGNVISGDRAATFQLLNNVSLVATDGAVEPPILSGDLLGDDGPHFLNNDDNSYHVVVGSGTNHTARLSGFIVTAGNANGASSLGWGGGMLNVGGSPTVVECTFLRNYAQITGAGMVNWEDSNTAVTNCSFIENSGRLGGGMNNTFSAPIITGCVFTLNEINATGGAAASMFNHDGDAIVADCFFTENTPHIGGAVFSRSGSDITFVGCVFANITGAKGGAMAIVSGLTTLIDCTFNENSSHNPFGGLGGGAIFNRGDTLIVRCTFTGNSTTTFGGAIANESNAEPIIVECKFSGNSADLHGGAIYNSHARPTLINCLFAANTAGLNGGAIYDQSNSSPQIVNSTLTGNVAGGNGGGLYTDFVGTVFSPVVVNSIVWDNTPDQIFDSGEPGTMVGHSDVEGGWSGLGSMNIALDPLFVDPDNGDYRLQAGSPCIDAGDNTAVPEDITTDLDGNPRFLEIPETPDTGNPPDGGPIVDMGAYESLGGGCLAVTSQEIVCHADGTMFTVNIEGLNACTGGTTQVTFTASGGAVGQELCFTALVNDGGFCCTTEICVTIPDCMPAAKPSDLDGDGIVGMVDFLALLEAWGSCSDCSTPQACPADFDGDCSVGILDLLILLGNWTA